MGAGEEEAWGHSQGCWCGDGYWAMGRRMRGCWGQDQCRTAGPVWNLKIPNPPALGDLDWMTPRGPFQPLQPGIWGFWEVSPPFSHLLLRRALPEQMAAGWARATCPHRGPSGTSAPLTLHTALHGHGAGTAQGGQ